MYLLRRDAARAQKKRMATRRQRALATREKRLYPASSKRIQVEVKPTKTAMAVFLRLQRRTSAIRPPPRNWCMDRRREAAEEVGLELSTEAMDLGF